MEYHSRPAPKSTAPCVVNDLGLLTLRFVTGLPMLFFQGWHQSFRAWAYVWDNKSWPLIEQFEKFGFAIPGFFATTLVIACTLCSLALLLGLYTRFNALLLLVLMLFILIVPVELSGNLNVQTLLLYAGLSLTLLFFGSGRISLDHLLTRRKRK